jgi:hypothetical protein
MEKINIYKHRGSGLDKAIDKIDVNYISEQLKSKNLSLKPFGLCSEPWDKYFNVSHKKGHVSSCCGIENNIHSRLNRNMTTLKKNIYVHSIDIYLNNGFYYFECMVQDSNKSKTSGPEDIVYKVEQENLKKYLPIILNEVFKHVE